MNAYINAWISPGIVFAPVHDGLPHPINIPLALVLALPQVDVGGDFPPPGLLVDFPLLFPTILFLVFIFLLPSSLFLLLFLTEFLQLLLALLFPFLFLLPFFLLNG